MSDSIKVVDSTDTKVKILLFAAIIFALIFVWFGVRWQIGNMLGELTSSSQENAVEIAALGMSLAPSDPLPRWLAANEERDTFAADNIDNAVKLFEDVVRLGPNDYRWWIELGRAYEQAEKVDDAERAFRRAVDLAPAYSFPRWQFGNFYLRQNRTEEAFAEMKEATERSITYRGQVFSLAWDYFDKDPSKLEQIVADTPDVRVSLALFYAARNSAQDSLRIWNTLSEEQKAANPKISTVIAQGLHDKRYYPEALEFARQIGIDPDARPETVTNGGFENFIGNLEDSLFGWRIVRNESRLDVSPDSTVKREGTRSLKATFRTYVKPTLYNIGQVVAVEPNTNYRLSFWLRTENLRSGGMPFLEVINGNDDKLITASQPFPIGTSDWQEVVLDFTTPENTTGVILRTSRAFCGEECPITGTFWYDDFRISSQ